jgi:hypothetical protein
MDIIKIMTSRGIEVLEAKPILYPIHNADGAATLQE